MAPRAKQPTSSLSKVTEAITMIVDALEGLPEEDQLLALETSVRLVRRETAPPIVSPAALIPAVIGPGETQFQEPEPPLAVPRATRNGARKINGSKPMRKESRETLDYVRTKGSLTTQDVMTKFGVGWFAAHRRMMRLAEFGLVNHSGKGEWKLVA